MSTSTTHRGIVVGVDGSPAAKVAVEWAPWDAALRNVSLTLVHVLNPPTVMMLPPTASTWPEVPMPSSFRQWQEAQVHRIIRDALKVVEENARAASPSQVNSELLEGVTVPTLVELSK